MRLSILLVAEISIKHYILTDNNHPHPQYFAMQPSEYDPGILITRKCSTKIAENAFLESGPPDRE